MIQFKEINEMDSPAAPFSAEAFKESRYDKLSIQDTKQYWNNLFAEFGNETEQIKNEVYGRDENEFHFDYDLKSDLVQEAIEPFRDSGWDRLDNEEKKIFIEELKNVLASVLEISDSPQIIYYEGQTYDCGSFNPKRNCIRINTANLDNPREIVNTIAHEMRHAYQYERSLKCENHLDMLYKYNFEHYIKPVEIDGYYINFFDYEDQLVEAEARAFARIFEKELD